MAQVLDKNKLLRTKGELIHLTRIIKEIPFFKERNMNDNSL